MTSAATYIVNAPAGYAASMDYKGSLDAGHPLVVRLAGVIGIAPEQLSYITPREVVVPCGMCQGTGYRREYAYNGGECYPCEGSGVHGYVTRFRVEYVAADDVAQLAGFRDHLNAGIGDDIMAWFLGGPKAPAELTADVA